MPGNPDSGVQGPSPQTAAGATGTRTRCRKMLIPSQVGDRGPAPPSPPHSPHAHLLPQRPESDPQKQKLHQTGVKGWWEHEVIHTYRASTVGKGHHHHHGDGRRRLLATGSPRKRLSRQPFWESGTLAPPGGGSGEVTQGRTEKTNHVVPARRRAKYYFKLKKKTNCTCNSVNFTFKLESTNDRCGFNQEFTTQKKDLKKSLYRQYESSILNSSKISAHHFELWRTLW